MSIAIIPARGGSKRIPGKNIKSFKGKPIIAYSIEAALDSECFDSVIVSTDSEEIARVAEGCGASIPFMRPTDLSGDYTPTVDVIQHALAFLEVESSCNTHACCIYATAPLLEANVIKACYVSLRASDKK